MTEAPQNLGDDENHPGTPVESQPSKISTENSDSPLQLGIQGALLGLGYAYRGNIPHPSIVEGWERNVPGSGARLLAMSEKALDAGILLKNKDQFYSFLSKTIGQLVGAGGLCLSSYITLSAIQNNMPEVAGAVGVTTIIALVSLVITGKWRPVKEEEQPKPDKPES